MDLVHKKFSGAAESATFNPLEKQMLFSFLGEDRKICCQSSRRGRQKFVFLVQQPQNFLHLQSNHLEEFLFLSGVQTEQEYSLVLDHSRNSVVQQNLLHSIQKRNNYCSLSQDLLQKSYCQSSERSTKYVYLEKQFKGTSSRSFLWKNSISGDAVFKKPNHLLALVHSRNSLCCRKYYSQPRGETTSILFTGTGSENTSVVEIASGRLFTFSSSTVVSAQCFETTGLFKLSGDARTRKFQDTKVVVHLEIQWCSESLTVNPDERQLLFSFVGERIAESKSTTETASGNIKIYPEASISDLFLMEFCWWNQT